MSDIYELLPLYFREQTIGRGPISRMLREGSLAVVTPGVYMGLPPRDDEVWNTPVELAKRINDTLARYALRIAHHVAPSATLAYASAYRFGPGPDRLITMVGITPARTLSLGASLGDYLPKEVEDHVQVVRVDIRRHRAVRQMRKAVDYQEVALDDGFERDPRMLAYGADSDATRRALARKRIRVTTPRRTVLDICAAGEQLGLTPAETEYQALLQWAGLPHHGADAARRIGEAEQRLRAEFPEVPAKAFDRLRVRLNVLAAQSELVPQAELNRRAATEEFSLRWHGAPFGILFQMRDGSWVFHYENGCPLRPFPEETNQRFPVFLLNLFPEGLIIQPHRRAAFLREHPRLLGNLTVVDAKEGGRRLPEDRLHYHLGEVCEGSAVYAGKLRGLPQFGPTFPRQTKNIATRGVLTQLSGLQAKIPMYMGREHLCPAVDSSFTHLLKFPMSSERANIEVMEWFAMSVVRAAGVDTADCRLVDLSTAEPGPLDPRLEGELDEALADVDPEQEARDRAAVNETIGSGHVTEILNAEGFRRLSYGAVARQEAGDDTAPLPAGYAALGLLVERFDIPTPSDPRWRLGEDFCSLSNRACTHDDVKSSGTMEEVADLLKRHSTRWGRDRLQLYRQVVANQLVCNSDGHLKNFTLLRIASYDGSRWEEVRLAPAYDVVMATVVLLGQRWSQPLTLGDTHTPGREELVRFAQSACEIDAPEAGAILDEMIEAARDKAAELATDPPLLIARDHNLASDIVQAERHLLMACRRLSAPGLVVRRPENGLRP